MFNRIPWPRKPIMDTRINVVDPINVELCAKMFVAVNGGQYGRHLENVASYGIRKYLIVFLDPKSPNSNTKIITVAILEMTICVKMCSASILTAILDFVRTQQNFNTNPRIWIQDINIYICIKFQLWCIFLYTFAPFSASIELIEIALFPCFCNWKHTK